MEKCHILTICEIYFTMARTKAYQAQVTALGQGPTAMVNVVSALADKNMKIMPEVLVTGGGGSTLDALMATLTQNFSKNGNGHVPAIASRETESKS